MKYRLVITTDGREGVLEQTLAAYGKFARPRPSEVVVVDDSGSAHYRNYLVETLPDWFGAVGGAYLISHTHRLGFCETVADGWAKAAEPGYEWIVWAEDDLELVRPVDWRDLAYVIECEPQVAQMALYRDAVSDAEKDAGGYIALHEGEYTPKGSGNVRWQETRRNWTTNLSVFPRAIAANHAWPVEEFCEGKFGFKLKEERPETTFGVWGDGKAFWTRHIGERAGTGY